MNRRRTDFQAQDVAAWPGVAYTEFGDDDRCAFQLRVNAVERYARGESIGDIELATGVKIVRMPSQTGVTCLTCIISIF
ncbi:hypothetical protein PQR67_36465 [Paraburkholderia fungorum]|uniref:hypothetical protein n=1 Tax=Paraburkholderia fungorum TaxID=134537 RepID=UPI0038BD64CE